MSLNDWDKINITSEEVNRIGEALKHEEFRKMLIDYCDEISNPENRKIYEEELSSLERERGVDITFINPTPGYVMKTSSDGSMKTFINIAKCEKIEKPSNTSAYDSDGHKGLNWKLPYIINPPRRDMDKKNQVCHVYDVIFHPDALELASKNKAFSSLVNDTAVNAVQQEFNVKLDINNIKFPKIAYKGFCKPTVIRNKIDNFESNIEKSVIDDFCPPIPDSLCKTPKQIDLKDEINSEDFSTPKYKIVQRKGVKFEEMTEGLHAKLNLTVPDELVVTVDLPLLKSSQDSQLDVKKKRLYFCSEKPKYRLDIALPYEISEEIGSAKFDQVKRQLIVTLSVLPEKRMKVPDLERFDSGIETESPQIIEEPENLENSDTDTFPHVLPNFTLNKIEETLAFTLHVKNVDPSSIIINRRDNENFAQVSFSSTGSGYYPIHYSFCVKFPDTSECIIKSIFAEAWDNNVIFQLELNDHEIDQYQAGLNEAELMNFKLENPSTKDFETYQRNEVENDLNIEIRNDKESELIIQVISKENFNEKACHTNDDEKPKEIQKRQTKRKKGDKKIRSMSESYCDELKVITEFDALKLDTHMENSSNMKKRSMSESSDEHTTKPVQTKYKSILKKGGSLSLSECNESSMDDHHYKKFYSISADLGICESHDSLSESCKKTVRFSDNIKRQIFRSNTSILAQKKKNQKKKASKKRALERRHSEGSESEKHDDFNERDDEDDETGSCSCSGEENSKKFDSGVDDIFDKKDDENQKVSMKSKNAKSKFVKSSNELQFKSGMIFDLEL